MTRPLTDLELQVIRFALNCENNLQNVKLPSDTNKVIEEYDGFVSFAEASNGSRMVGSAAVITKGDHVAIDVFCNDQDQVCAIVYVSMYGHEPPRFPQSVDELSCDVSYTRP